MADDRDARIAQLEAELATLQTEVGRLRPALSEALEQQTAIAEVLRIIASSPADASVVLQAIIDSAARLCQADGGVILRVDGDELERMANFLRGAGPHPVGQRMPILPGSWTGQTVLEKRTIHHDDVEAIMDREYPVSARYQRARHERQGASAYHVRSLLLTPLLRDGKAIGVLDVSRGEVRPFTDRQIALLEAFADQAVIAIDNARLFAELEQGNRDLSEAL